jgi:hypothetical protein
LPYHENKITLDKSKKDKWGLPVLSFDAEIKDNELKMRGDMQNEMKEMLESIGVKIPIHTITYMVWAKVSTKWELPVWDVIQNFGIKW